jgi:hypothetical protein
MALAWHSIFHHPLSIYFNMPLHWPGHLTEETLRKPQCGGKPTAFRIRSKRSITSDTAASTAETVFEPNNGNHELNVCNNYKV